MLIAILRCAIGGGVISDTAQHCRVKECFARGGGGGRARREREMSPTVTRFGGRESNLAATTAAASAPRRRTNHMLVHRSRCSRRWVTAGYVQTK